MGFNVFCCVGFAVGDAVGCSVGQAANSHPMLMSLLTVEPSKQILVSSEHDGQEKKAQSLVLVSRPRIDPSAQSILSSGFTPSGHNGKEGDWVGVEVGCNVLGCEVG